MLTNLRCERCGDHRVLLERRELVVEEALVQHAVALLEGGYAFANSLDGSSGVKTEDGGVSLDEESERLDLPVDGVQASGFVLDEKLARTGLRDIARADGE